MHTSDTMNAFTLSLKWLQEGINFIWDNYVLDLVLVGSYIISDSAQLKYLKCPKCTSNRAELPFIIFIRSIYSDLCQL